MPRLSGPGPRAGPSLATQIVAGLQAAALIARGKEEGLRFAMLSPAGAARSFWAGAICLVPFLVIRSMRGAELFADSLPAELIGYVMGWVVFPLVALAMADGAGRGPLWPLFVSAWNWANLTQYLALLVASLLGMVLPSAFAGPILILAFGYALWMEWFVARAALKISSGRAVLFVVADMGIGLFVASVVTRLAG